MKGMIILSPFVISASSYPVKTQTDIKAEPVLGAYRPRNLGVFKIESALRQLDYEYNQANRAISVNDAEKAYIGRYVKGLQDKCRLIRKALLDKKPCNR